MDQQTTQAEQNAVVKPATSTVPTVEDRLTALEKRASVTETNHQSLLGRLRKKIAYFDR